LFPAGPGDPRVYEAVVVLSPQSGHGIDVEEQALLNRAMPDFLTVVGGEGPKPPHPGRAA